MAGRLIYIGYDLGKSWRTRLCISPYNLYLTLPFKRLPIKCRYGKQIVSCFPKRSLHTFNCIPFMRDNLFLGKLTVQFLRSVPNLPKYQPEKVRRMVDFHLPPGWPGLNVRDPMFVLLVQSMNSQTGVVEDMRKTFPPCPLQPLHRMDYITFILLIPCK